MHTGLHLPLACAAHLENPLESRNWCNVTQSLFTQSGIIYHFLVALHSYSKLYSCYETKAMHKQHNAA